MSVRAGPVRFGGGVALLLWSVGLLLRAVVGVIVFAVCRPRTTVGVLGLVAAGWAVHTYPLGALVVLLLVLEAGNLAELAAPGSCRRRLLAWWRSVWVYRRHWQPAMLVAELDADGPNGGRRLPRLVGVRCTDTVDLVRIRGLLGQRFTDWEAAGPMLAHVFGAVDYRVHRGGDRRLTLELVRGRRDRSWHREGFDYGEDL